MQSEKKQQELQAIVKELTSIREDRESKTLRIAELLATVNDGKMYKDIYVTFAGFCEFVGYSRGYAYDLIKIYENDQVRNAFDAIGALNARTIARKADKLDDSVVADLVNYAKEHKTPKVKVKVQQAVDEKRAANTPAPETNPLKIALAKQTTLLKYKASLEALLVKANADLVILDKEIAKLSK